ncbi:hypothetical protein KAFR_0G02020 [Kazachstania africana CBS 2517]|uniref:Genetic interactor of prohibitins 3, mitochondrial n=1 Tax=Kazachstania africana (strain ATCC 22294 / BCRC 22015 / CBS 2517 / CECT 1963 / NBRC 1671 / NRRL Y-8276) TaxID=1071382 RepID=H2AXY6_KAZAF|nr:hypothetical protein KAFR_0G02020 [Kazachstania africana CBS 2517]CCF59236.1 hypothetical protein KAFR_0G02020 [Kazachstania africana CBS 2517]
MWMVRPSCLLVARRIAGYSRCLSCNACGVDLQKQDPTGKGYYIQPSKHETNFQKEIEAVKYMLFSQDIQVLKDAGKTQSQKEEHSLICKRCNDALHHNKYDLRDFPRTSIPQLYESIPLGGKLLHVVPFSEFPLGLSKKVLTDRKHDASLLLTKSDQVLSSKGTLSKYVPQFLQDFMKYQMGLTTNKTIAMSSLRNWNIELLNASLRKMTFLFGCANAGKSTLINTLSKKYTGHKVNFHKQGNLLAIDEDVKNSTKSQMAGVSHIPNMTRALQGYQIQDKVIFDLPGYTEDMDAAYLEQIVRKDWIKRVRDTALFKHERLKKKNYVTLKGTEQGSCYTLGGLFFIVPPKGTINQIVNYIPGEYSIYRNIDKALEVFKNCNANSNHALDKYCGILSSTCTKEAYIRHIIPPFRGSIEIVFKDIGYVLLRTTGKFDFMGFHEVWAPRGIKVIIREPLEKTIRASSELYIQSKGVQPACPTDRMFFSSTYEIPFGETDILSKMKEMYLERTRGKKNCVEIGNEDPFIIIERYKANTLTNPFWYYNF